MPPKTATNTLSAYSEHEKLTATRMHWWGIFLIREGRRLQGIADRVRAQPAEAPDELLARLDAEVVGQEALAKLETAEGDEASRVPEEPCDATT